MSIIGLVPSPSGELVTVEVLDLWDSDSPAGMMAAVRATDGKPFVGGNKWPVRTEFATVKATSLIIAEKGGVQK